MALRRSPVRSRHAPPNEFGPVSERGQAFLFPGSGCSAASSPSLCPSPVTEGARGTGCTAYTLRVRRVAARKRPPRWPCMPRGKRYSCQMVSSPAKGKIVPRNEVDAVVAGIPPFSMHRCVSIAFGPPRERPRNLGTATVVNMFGGVFLVTAKHVVDSVPAKKFPWRLLVPARDSAGRIPDRASLSPRAIPIDSSAVIWTSELNDVAVLRAPPELNTDSFDGELRAVAVARSARETWDQSAAQDAFQMVVITGFPSFGRNDRP